MAPDSAGLRHRQRSPIVQRMSSQRSRRSDGGSDLAEHRSLSSALSVDAAQIPEVLSRSVVHSLMRSLTFVETPGADTGGGPGPTQKGLKLHGPFNLIHL